MGRVVQLRSQLEPVVERPNIFSCGRAVSELIQVQSTKFNIESLTYPKMRQNLFFRCVWCKQKRNFKIKNRWWQCWFSFAILSITDILYTSIKSDLRVLLRCSRAVEHSVVVELALRVNKSPTKAVKNKIYKIKWIEISWERGSKCCFVVSTPLLNDLVSLWCSLWHFNTFGIQWHFGGNKNKQINKRKNNNIAIIIVGSRCYGLLFNQILTLKRKLSLHTRFVS